VLLILCVSIIFIFTEQQYMQMREERRRTALEPATSSSSMSIDRNASTTLWNAEENNWIANSNQPVLEGNILIEVFVFQSQPTRQLLLLKPCFMLT
jgi:hypothetical protein